MAALGAVPLGRAAAAEAWRREWPEAGGPGRVPPRAKSDGRTVLSPPP